MADDRVVRERDPMGAAHAEGRDGSPNATDDELHALARMFRYALTPGDEYAYGRMSAEVDVGHVLSAIAVPTLVLQNAEDNWVPVERGRELAELIPGSTYVEVPIRGHIPALADIEAFLDPIESFLREASEDDAVEREPERVLATVLFTDIVDSTARMAELGDRAWRDLLERHHAVVRSRLARSRGREVDTAGDGFFAAFDGPARAVVAAAAIRDSLRPLDLEIRAGLHTGECEVSDGKVAGIAVSIGARIASLAESGEILVSSTVKDLVAGSDLRFEPRGEHRLKGVPEPWRLFALAA
jgi:class 3 adenylate cyclase